MKHRFATVVLIAVMGLAAAPGHAAVHATSGPHAGPYSGLGWYLIGLELGPWEDYLRHRLTEDLDGLDEQLPPHINWVQLDERLLLPDFARELLGDKRQQLSLSLQRSELERLLRGSSDALDQGYLFKQSMLMPGISGQVGDNSALTVSAVLASQHFGTADLNLQRRESMTAADRYRLGYNPYRHEMAHGTGLRFALHSELTEDLTFEAAFQSRINMSEFASFRGVHGARAEFDIPSRVKLGLQLSATERSWLNVGVSQIFYSEINAFASRSLPSRFIGLLGDSTSPHFGWNDLTTYSIGWHWRHDNDLELYLDYRGRTQPRPDSAALAAALAPELSSNSVLAGLSKSLGKRSRLHLSAAYAPPEFAFGGHVIGATGGLDQDLEVQALLDFTF